MKMFEIQNTEVKKNKKEKKVKTGSLSKKQIILITSVCISLMILLFVLLAASVYKTIKPLSPKELTEYEASHLEYILNQNYKERTQLVSQLPYPTFPKELFINARSAILIDTATGSILFEKNADEEIPPASMTKLVEMYVVFDAVEKGEVKLSDEVPLPKESWAQNLPGDASIMFLAQGQHVTLHELLLGLSIASGNDASIAVANYVCGSMEEFVGRMNDVIKSMNLTHTHFVESSGYSEKNITTAREFSAFCRAYITRFPFALEDYHSQKELRYPKEKNLPDWIRNSDNNPGDSQAVIQYNTNKLLGQLPGCDGLKTGFINESGYNIALTAERYGTRFLSVTMGGPGNGSREGNIYRSQDGTSLMEYAFESFADYHAPDGENKHVFTVGVTGSKNKSINLIPALEENLTVPFITGGSPKGAASSVTARAYVPDVIYGDVKAGEAFGTITYSIGDTVLRTIPLVADRDSPKKKGLCALWGKTVYCAVKILR